jgi:adenylylsulfate kinase
MGLPGSGKTTLAEELVTILRDNNQSVTWLNADLIREFYNDWDFSVKGRIRQATRMRELADNSNSRYIICDFVAPTKDIRDIFNADYTVWVNTLFQSRYEDTNNLFESPKCCDLIIRNKNAKKWAKLIAHFVLKDNY